MLHAGEVTFAQTTAKNVVTGPYSPNTQDLACDASASGWGGGDKKWADLNGFDEFKTTHCINGKFYAPFGTMIYVKDPNVANRKNPSMSLDFGAHNGRIKAEYSRQQQNFLWENSDIGQVYKTDLDNQGGGFAAKLKKAKKQAR